MPKKSYSKDRTTCRVTFRLPAEAGAAEASLAGEFNEWQPKPLSRRKDGSFSGTVALAPGRSYRYRFLIDGERWENDWEADRYEANPYGEDDSIVEV